jgi:biotin synthase-related radical SAM superfamily protein
MKVLAINKKTGVTMSFATLQLFENAKKLFNGDLELSEEQYGMTKKVIPQIIEKQEFDTKNFTFEESQELIDSWNESELNAFASDKRQNISKLANKLLNKKS